MSEYIKREDALIVAEIGGSKETIKANLKNISSADVVEVVRCRDCRYYNGTCEYWTSVPYGQACTKKNDFCSRGERKDGESE